MADTGIKQGSKLYVCATPQPENLDQAGFEALTWVLVGNVVELPGIGVTDNIVSQDYIGTDTSQKRKGFRSVEDGTIIVGRDYEDDGQIALRNAAGTRYNYAFKLESSDSPSALYTNTIRYSRGVVSGPNFVGGGGEEFDNEEFTIGFNQIPITVDPELI